MCSKLGLFRIWKIKIDVDFHVTVKQCDEPMYTVTREYTCGSIIIRTWLPNRTSVLQKG